MHTLQQLPQRRRGAASPAPHSGAMALLPRTSARLMRFTTAARACSAARERGTWARSHASAAHRLFGDRNSLPVLRMQRRQPQGPLWLAGASRQAALESKRRSAPPRAPSGLPTGGRECEQQVARLSECSGAGRPAAARAAGAGAGAGDALPPLPPSSCVGSPAHVCVVVDCTSFCTFTCSPALTCLQARATMQRPSVLHAANRLPSLRGTLR